MLRFVTKKEYWKIENTGILKELPTKFMWHLKSIQDAVAFEFLREQKGKKIAEVGGGDSRILEAIKNSNECYNIDYFDGSDGGPKNEVKIDGVENVITYLGEFSPKLKDDFYDIVYSISVVEHIPISSLPAFFKDCHRILAVGGTMIHLIDVYLEEEDNAQVINTIREYKAVFKNGLFKACTPEEELIIPEEVKFKTPYASNPDSILNLWNRSAPLLVEKRERSQSVTLILKGIK